MSEYLDSFYTKLNAIVAAGIGIPNGPGANDYFWMIQPRDRRGQWIEMGVDVEALIELPDGRTLSVIGKAIGSNGTEGMVRVLVRGYGDQGVPDQVLGVKSSNAQKVAAVLPKGYAKSKGAKETDINGNTISGRRAQKLAEMETAEITPDDVRMAEQGQNAPEAKLGKDFENSPEGQAIAKLPADGAEVASPEEVADLVDGGWTTTADGRATMTMPNGAVITVGRDGSYGITDNKGWTDTFSMYAPEEAPGLEAGKANALAAFNENPDSYVWKSAEDFGPGWEMKDYGNGKGQYMKDNDPNQSFNIGDAYEEEFMAPSGGFAPFFTARNYAWGEAAFNEGIEYKSFDTPEAALAAAKDFIDRHPSGKSDDADNAIADLMNKVNSGDDTPDLDSIINSKKGGDEPSNDDEELDDEEPAVPVEDLFDQGPGEQSDLTGARSASYAVTPEDIGKDDIILGPFGDPVKITKMTWGDEDEGEDPDSVTIDFVDAAGNEDSMEVSRYDDLTMVDLEPVAPATPATSAEPVKPAKAPKKPKAAKTPEPITPEDATPVEEPELAAPDTAKEIPASEVEVGDTWYSKGGATELGEVTAVRNNPDKPGQKQVRLSLAGRKRPDWWDLSDTALINKGEKPAAPEVPETPEAPAAPEVPNAPEKPKGTSEQATRLADLEGEGIDDPALADEVAKVLDYQGPISELDGEYLDDLIARVEDSQKDKPAKETPAGPEEVEIPEDEKPEDRVPSKRRGDTGADEMSRVAASAEQMAKAKITKLRDKDGKLSELVDIDGELVNPDDPDSALAILAQQYPEGFFIDDAADELNGGFMTHRMNIDGGKTRMEIIVTRSTNNQYMVTMRFTNKETGEVTQLHHYKPRHTLAGVHGERTGPEHFADIFSGKKSPVKEGGKDFNAYFGPDSTWQDKVKYWRDKYSKSNKTLDKWQKELTSPNPEIRKRAEQAMDDLQNLWGGDLAALNRASTLEDTRMLTTEERLDYILNGRAESLNETTDYNLGVKRKSAVKSLLAAFKSGDRRAARLRYAAMLSVLPDNDVARAAARKAFKDAARADAERMGLKGKALKKQVQRINGFMTAFSNFANGQFKPENDIPLPHAEAGGIRIHKAGDLVEYEDNVGRKSVGRVVYLQPKSGPNQNEDFLWIQFRDDKGRLHTITDLAAKNTRILDTEEDLTPYAGWQRGTKLTNTRLGPQAAATRARALQRKRLGIAYVGEEGKQGEDAADGDFPIESDMKIAADLDTGDDLFGEDGEKIGSVLSTTIKEYKGDPVVIVTYQKLDGKKGRLIYPIDELVGPGDDSPKASASQEEAPASPIDKAQVKSSSAKNKSIDKLNKPIELDDEDELDLDLEDLSEENENAPAPMPEPGVVPEGVYDATDPNSTIEFGPRSVSRSIDERHIGLYSDAEIARMDALEKAALRSRKQLEEAVNSAKPSEVVIAKLKELYMAKLRDQSQFGHYLAVRLSRVTGTKDYPALLKADPLLSAEEIDSVNARPTSVKDERGREMPINRVVTGTPKAWMKRSVENILSELRQADAIGSNMETPDGWSVEPTADGYANGILNPLVDRKNANTNAAALMVSASNNGGLYITMGTTIPGLENKKIKVEFQRNDGGGDPVARATPAQIKIVADSLAKVDKAVGGLVPKIADAGYYPDGSMPGRALMERLFGADKFTSTGRSGDALDIYVGEFPNDSSFTPGTLAYASKLGIVKIHTGKASTIMGKPGEFSIDAKTPEEQLEHTVIHELGHVFQYMSTTKDDFEAHKGTRPHRDDPDGVQTSYAKESGAEHFAESFARFVVRGEMSPKFRQYLISLGIPLNDEIV